MRSSIYLPYVMFDKVVKCKQLVKNIFRTRPMAANMLTYGTMYSFAEASQQIIINRSSPRKKKVDWETIGRYGIIAVGILGPTLFYWYRFLDKSLPSTTKTSLFAKVIIDQAVAATGSTVIFFTGMSILEGKQDIFAELKAKFIPTYTKKIDLGNSNKLEIACQTWQIRNGLGGVDVMMSIKWLITMFFSVELLSMQMSCCFWLPAQAINFALLPPYTRVAFVGMASFIWVNVLCLVKRQELPEENSKTSLNMPLAEVKGKAAMNVPLAEVTAK